MIFELHVYILLIYLAGLTILLFTSSNVVHFIMKKVYSKPLEQIAESDNNIAETANDVKNTERISTGRIIGKCENIIVIILMFFQAYTSLAIIFTAKTIIRKEDIMKNSMYFLVGTMINVTYNLTIGFIVHFFTEILREYYLK